MGKMHDLVRMYSNLDTQYLRVQMVLKKDIMDHAAIALCLWRREHPS